MSLDISGILRDWPYEPGQVTVRRIRGRDGRERIQLRLDLGVLQMEVDGRPDGHRPHGFKSLLRYYERRRDKYVADRGSDEGFTLDAHDCELLRGEGILYYHRYFACFVLGDYERVRRDTLRNLRLFDFCLACAARQEDRYVLEQYRPYVLMMLTRAQAKIAMKTDGPSQALSTIRNGIRKIEEFFIGFAQEDMAADSGEIAILNAMAIEIESQIPKDPIEKLREDLSHAIAEERYEDAASLRDRLRHEIGMKMKAGR